MMKHQESLEEFPVEREPGADFEEWWYEYGSALRSMKGEDYEEHAKRVAEYAWRMATIRVAEAYYK